MTVYVAMVDGVSDQDRADRRAFFGRDAAVAWACGLARERFGRREPVEELTENRFGCVWTGWAGTRCRASVDAVEVGDAFEVTEGVTPTLVMRVGSASPTGGVG